MLVCIPAVLDWTELKKVRAAIAEGSFEDGRRTAGRRAKRVKNNLQLKKGDDRADEIKDIVLAAAVGARNRMGGRPPRSRRWRCAFPAGDTRLVVEAALSGGDCRAWDR